MSLLSCPDCEGKVSDLAPACPHCGRPTETFPAPPPPAPDPEPVPVRSNLPDTAKYGKCCRQCGALSIESATNCFACGNYIEYSPVRSRADLLALSQAPGGREADGAIHATTPAEPGPSGVRIVGGVLLLAGCLGLLMALSMDTSVEAGAFGRVNNVGLMADRQNYIMIACVLGLGGLILCAFGGKRG